MGRGGHGTHHFTRSVLAVHARDRLKKGFRIIERAFVIAVDAKPVHLARPAYLRLSDDRDVVFGLASHHAGAAADAGI